MSDDFAERALTAWATDKWGINNSINLQEAFKFLQNELSYLSLDFDTDDHYRQNIRRDRIKLFIALTRAMREIRLYYINYQHPFIKEIRKLEAEMSQ